jgi:hypothetical protein
MRCEGAEEVGLVMVVPLAASFGRDKAGQMTPSGAKVKAGQVLLPARSRESL